MADEGVKGSDPADQCDDAFLKKIESSMLSQVKLQGISGIKKVTIRNVSRLVVRPEDGQGYFQENEWMLDTEGVNLQEVCHTQAPLVMSYLHGAAQLCSCLFLFHGLAEVTVLKPVLKSGYGSESPCL